MTYTALSNNQHARLRLSQGTYNYLNEQPVVSIFSSEAGLACLDLPLAFAPGEKGISLVAVLSLNKGNNAQVGPKGYWMGGYMPVLVRCHPFSLALQGQQAVVLVDEDSDWLSTEQGEPLFDEQGNPTEILNKQIQLLQNSAPNPQLEANALRAIYDSGLLQTWIEVPQKLLAISLKSLSSLDDEGFKKLRKSGALPIIFAHIFSQYRIERIKNLAQQKQNMTDKQISQDDSFAGTLDLKDDIFRFST